MSLALTVMTSLFGLYWLYALLVTPWLVPPTIDALTPAIREHSELQAEPPAGNMEDAERYLSHEPWTARAKFQVRLAKGLLFTNEWRPLDEARGIFEFQPFAMIWFDTPAAEAPARSARDQEPLTLISERGLIQFSSKFDPINQRTGRIIGGKLEGKVTVAGPEQLTLTGRDVFFDESTMELRSDSPVRFTYQRHHGHAQGMKVELLPSAEPPRPDQLLTIGGFRRVNLRGRVELHLLNEDGPLHVTCDEGCHLNPSERVALFQVNVHVVRPTSSDAHDRLLCDDLYLFWDEEPGEPSSDPLSPRGDAPTVVPIGVEKKPLGVSASGPRPALSGSLPERGGSPRDFHQLTLRQLRATGRKVELESQSQGLTAVMTSLTYDLPSRTAKLSAIPADNKPGRAPLNVVVVRHANSRTELTSPYLELTHSEEGQVVSATGRGAGRLRRKHADSQVVNFSAKWQSSFRLRPEPNSGLDVLELLGQAVVEQTDRGTALKAEQIQLWFDRTASAKAPADHPAARVSTNDTKPHAVPDAVPVAASRDFRPRQLRAHDNVVVISPQLAGRTQEFLVHFLDRPVSPTQLATKPKPGDRLRLTAGQQKRNTGQGDGRLNPSTEPLQLTADTIRANLILEDSAPTSGVDSAFDIEVTDVWTEGHVDIQQPNSNSNSNDAPPLHVTGEWLHLKNASRDGEQVMHITGRPAVVRARGFDIEGHSVFVDRPRNRTWIEGAGALRLPVKNDPFHGRKLTSSTLLTVWWKEQMTFDGQVANFFGNVKAAMSDSRLQCQEMEVTLTERVLLTTDASKADSAEVESVVCRNHVEIDQTMYVDRDLTEIRRGHFATMTLNQTTGQMEAIGPGEISLWRPGRGKRAALAPRAVAQANQPLETEVSNWEFTRITFQGKAHGNLHDRATRFQDRVHIVYGPVGQPLETIDPDHLPRNGGDMQCESLQIVQQQGDSKQPPYIELEARGNAKLEGHTFNARADEITFDESKELYTLRAHGNRQVTIWRQVTPDGEPSEASFKSVRFIPSRNYLRSDETTGIRGAN
jgi:lipopolysaccharide export system protein LptA